MDVYLRHEDTVTAGDDGEEGCVLTIIWWAIAILLASSQAQSALVVRISDLQYSPTPPNPIRTFGTVTSVSPLRLTDGTNQVVVTGVAARVGDFLIVEGDYAGGVLAVTQVPGKAALYAAPAMTEMVYVPPGSFQMGNNGSEPFTFGNELPRHEVYLSGYWLGRCEVTRGEYRQFIAGGGYGNPACWSSAGWNWRLSQGRTEPRYWAAQQDWDYPLDDGEGGFTQTDEHPVVGVVYYEAEAYCSWAGGALPTEAQWEKAARWTGSHSNVFPWGDTWEAEFCNNFWDSNPAGGGLQASQTAPAGSYPGGASPFGCLDMAGNVWEWCRDWYGATYYSASPAVDPQGPATGAFRVIRGGGWDDYSLVSRCAYRFGSLPPAYPWNSHGGFRLARPGW